MGGTRGGESPNKSPPSGGGRVISRYVMTENAKPGARLLGDPVLNDSTPEYLRIIRDHPHSKVRNPHSTLEVCQFRTESSNLPHFSLLLRYPFPVRTSHVEGS